MLGVYWWQASTGSLETYAHYKRGRAQSAWTRSWVVFDGVSGSLSWRKHAGDRHALGTLAMHRFQVRRRGDAQQGLRRAHVREGGRNSGGARSCVLAMLPCPTSSPRRFAPTSASPDRWPQVRQPRKVDGEVPAVQRQLLLHHVDPA